MRFNSVLTAVLNVCFVLPLLQQAPVDAQEADQLDLNSPQVLAEGVLKTMPPLIHMRDTHSLPMVAPGIAPVDFTPNQAPHSATLYQLSRSVIVFRDVWQYEFSFLPLRQIEVDVPASDNRTVKRTFWYMVYYVRNTGHVVTNEFLSDPNWTGLENFDQDFELRVPEPITDDQQSDLDRRQAALQDRLAVILDPHWNKQIYRSRANFEQLNDERRQALLERLKRETLFQRFIGNLELKGWVEDPTTGRYVQVNYNQVINPEVRQQIQQKEDPLTELHDAAQLIRKELPVVAPGNKFGGVWGVAIWEGVDPRLDFISVKVGGLTNAFRLRADSSGEMQTANKILQLNFWRGGDAVRQANDEIIYGIPIADDFRRQIEICYRYELPGPIIEGIQYDATTGREQLLFEVDAAVSLRTLQSGFAMQLDEGRIPEPITQAFDRAGISLPEGTAPITQIAGKEWEIRVTLDGEEKIYQLRLEPRFWEPTSSESIQFTDRLDHLWIYE